MSQRRAQFTEVEVRRALKAAKAEGFDRVELTQTPDGVKVVIERTRKGLVPDVVERLEI